MVLPSVLAALPPLPVDPGIAIVSLIVATALYMFYREVLPIDVTAIGIIVALVVFGRWTEVGPADALSGFSSTATITILSFFIISEGVRETGIVQMISRRIMAVTGNSERKQLLTITSISGTFSGVINNAAVVSVLIPVVNDMAEKIDISPSKLLMPMSFVAINAGQLTLVASTDNLIVSDITGRLLNHPIGMFELTALGAAMFLTSILYFMTIGYRLVPDRKQHGANLIEFDLKDYLTELSVPEDSPFAGMTIREAMADIEADVDVLQLVRDGTKQLPPRGYTLQPGDVLQVVTDKNSLENLIDRQGIELVPETEEAHEELEKEEDAYTLINAMIAPNSSLIGETLGTVDFRRHYEASVLAIKRKGEVLRREMDDVRFRAGDFLLLQASEEALDILAETDNFVLDRGSERISYRSEKAPIAAAIVAAVVGTAALGYLPIEIAGLGGIFSMVLAGCISPAQIYRNVDWSIIFLISGVIPLGIAIERTGLAHLLAESLTTAGASLSPVAMLALVYIVSQLVTELVNDSAAVVFLAPIAIEVGQTIGADPFSFALAVLFAAGGAVLTPIGFQTNLMIYGPGGYTFRDFLRVGFPLKILLTIVSVTGIVLLWGV